MTSIINTTNVEDHGHFSARFSPPRSTRTAVSTFDGRTYDRRQLEFRWCAIMRETRKVAVRYVFGDEFT